MDVRLNISSSHHRDDETVKMGNMSGVKRSCWTVSIHELDSVALQWTLLDLHVFRFMLFFLFFLPAGRESVHPIIFLHGHVSVSVDQEAADNLWRG